MTPDVNVLVAAMRLDHPHHAPAFNHLQTQLKLASQRPNDASIVLLGVVVAGFIRVVTNRRIFQLPSSLKQAIDFVDTLLLSPGVVFQGTGSQWPGFRDLCLRAEVNPDSATDIWIAASAMQWGEILHTFDRDFKKILPDEHLYLVSR
ncbi:MAG: PIN domain-containing protein [Limnohabitans sp.]|nr:PIN domain-containing protein [Limnohabitans sp.]